MEESLNRRAEIKNFGKECWGNCGSEQGPCEWCGAKGYCCTLKIGWNDTSKGCDGTFGGVRRHECVLKPGKSFIIDLAIQNHLGMNTLS